MQSEIKIRNTANTCYIDIEGTIGIPEEWQFENPDQRVATYQKFRDTLQLIEGIDASKIVVNIRSTGGDVNDALLIHEALVGLKAEIVTRCYGYTASAATIIAQSASEGSREVSENTLYLIHNSICASEGNANDLEVKLDLLRKTDQRLAQVYANRSGKDAESFVGLMAENSGNGRWLSPTEVIELGLADKTIAPENVEQTETPIQNIANRWGRLVAKFKGEDEKLETPPTMVNIHHFGEVTNSQEQTIVKMQSGQKDVAPTKTDSTEDPSMGEPSLSSNEKAYADDVRRLSTI